MPLPLALVKHKLEMFAFLQAAFLLVGLFLFSFFGFFLIIYQFIVLLRFLSFL